MSEFGFPQFGSVEHGISLKRRVQRVARAIRAACGQARALRFDPWACAEHFGVEVYGTDLPEGLSGRLSFLGDVPTIEYHRMHPEVRVRFTISHELGHLCFLETKPIYPKERGEIGSISKAQKREEWLCNMIAAELLMPSVSFRRIAGAVRQSLPSLRQMKEIFGVSTASVLRRICDLQTWSVGMADWVIVNGSKPQRRGRPRIVVKGAFRGRVERERVRRRIEQALNRAEARGCQSLRDGSESAEGWTAEAGDVVMSVTPYRFGTSRGVLAFVLHQRERTT